MTKIVPKIREKLLETTAVKNIMDRKNNCKITLSLDSKALLKVERLRMGEDVFLDIPEGVEDIVDYACVNIDSCKLGGGINRERIVGIGIKGVNLPKTLKSIGDYAFYNNCLTELICPNSIEYIGDYAFALNEIRNLKLSQKCYVIKSHTFYWNYLTTINLQYIDRLEESALESNDFENIYCFESLKFVGKNALRERAVFREKKPNFIIKKCWNYNRLVNNILSSGVIINEADITLYGKDRYLLDKAIKAINPANSKELRFKNINLTKYIDSERKSVLGYYGLSEKDNKETECVNKNIEENFKVK